MFAIGYEFRLAPVELLRQITKVLTRPAQTANFLFPQKHPS
jgi:hypothetical protein